MSLELQIELGTVLVLLAIVALGVFANYRHGRTRRKLNEMHEDMTGGMKTLHDRADRENVERIWALQGVRSALEMIRMHLISLFRSRR